VGLIAHGDRECRLPLGSGTKQMSSILETLTLSKTQGDSSLASVLLRNRHQFDSAASLIVVTSSTSTEWISIVRQLRYSDLNVAVVLVDATSFGGDQSPDKVVAELVGVGIPVYVVRRGDTLPYALSQPIISPEVLMFAHRDRSERIRSSAITG
jgi:uncharacterized protein (DUF58 family)